MMSEAEGHRRIAEVSVKKYVMQSITCTWHQKVRGG